MEHCQSSETGSCNNFSLACDDTTFEKRQETEAVDIIDENIAVESGTESGLLTSKFLNPLSTNTTVDIDSLEQETNIEKSIREETCFGGNTPPDSLKAPVSVDSLEQETNIEKPLGEEACLEGNDPSDSLKNSVIIDKIPANDCVTHIQEHSEKNESFITRSVNCANETSQVNPNLLIETITIDVAKETASTPVQKEQPVKNIVINNGYRCGSDSWSDDEDGSSTSDSSSDSDTFFEAMHENSTVKKLPFVKTKGELELEDLPPIEDLVISVNESEMVVIGKIHAIVEKLVVVHALKDMKPLDLDSVLFLSHEQPLGRVFDVFGPVLEPFYSVRFNHVDDINSIDVNIGADVFFAPTKSDITSYVFVDKLQNQKGSDASWKDNNEPPEEYLDYSDDEEEKAAKRKRSAKHRNREINNDSIPSKRPTTNTGDSSHQSSYIAPLRPISHWNNLRNVQSPRMMSSNPFASPPIYRLPVSHSPSICNSRASPSPSIYSLPASHSPSVYNSRALPSASIYSSHASPSPSIYSSPVSPSPSIYSLLSPAPVRIQNSFRTSSPNQPQFQYSPPQRIYPQQSVLYRPSSPMILSPYQQPHIFGQVSVLSPLSPALGPSPLASPVPTLIPASHYSPGTTPNYFSQRFPRSQSPISQSRDVLPDPWLPNRAPIPSSHPLTVQIPNINNPALEVQQFQQNMGNVQPSYNNVNTYMQSRFYPR